MKKIDYTKQIALNFALSYFKERPYMFGDEAYTAEDVVEAADKFYAFMVSDEELVDRFDLDLDN